MTGLWTIEVRGTREWVRVFVPGVGLTAYRSRTTAERYRREMAAIDRGARFRVRELRKVEVG